VWSLDLSFHTGQSAGMFNPQYLSFQILIDECRYDRYWMGKTAWGDVIRNTRSLGRLIWFHVPLLLTAKTADELTTGKVQRPVAELKKVMAEKNMALDMVEGYVLPIS
jgi:predicted membrane chloride channel (bestrophin family)